MLTKSESTRKWKKETLYLDAKMSIKREKVNVQHALIIINDK